MKKIFLILLIAVIAQCSLWADAGTDLFNKVKVRYSTCASFYCQGDDILTSDEQSKDHPYKAEKKFSIRFQRPALLRVDWIEPSVSSFSPVTNSLYTQNGKYYTVLSFQPMPKQMASLDEAMGAMAGVSDGNSLLIPALLLGKSGYFHSPVCKVLPDATMNGSDCNVLQITTTKAGTFTIYINKTTLGIVHIHQVQKVDVAQLRKDMEKAIKNMTIKPVLPQNDFSIERTYNYDSVSFDQKMKPEEFVFPETK
ncbi:MAG: hypothetical protein ACREFE_06805 [Limisphaerales bacterium]